MTINLLRFVADDDQEPKWGVQRGDLVIQLPGTYATAEHVLSEGVSDARSLSSDVPGRPLTDITVLNPLPGARIFCQGANYRSHMIESGMRPERSFNMLFIKSTGSLCGPDDDIVKPAHVKLLDYEVELGLVIGKAVSDGTPVTADNLADYIAAFVVANDVSARDIQLIQGQWYKGKSYRTFCPVGPYLCIPDRDEVRRWGDLRLTLQVNGEVRQNSLAADMVFGPVETLNELALLEDLRAGDLLITGTPGGVALQPPRAIVQRLGALLPDERRWDLFVKAQGRASAYLQPGDKVTANIRTDDGTIDLGTQHNTVTSAGR